MIKEIISRGANKADCQCDNCSNSTIIGCDYERKRGGRWVPRQGQAINKLRQSGWGYVRGRLYCPECEAERRAREPEPTENEDAMTENVTDMRRPTPAQKRQIIALLEEVYDDKKLRYIGGETDKTVADTVGGGCMFGWVAEIRAELFGPDGSNEDMDKLAADLADARDLMASLEKQMADLKAAMDGAKKALGAIDAKAGAIMKTVGPAAARVK